MTIAQKILIVIILLAILVFPIVALDHYGSQHTNLYALTTVVTEVDMEADTVTCEDYNDNLWVFDGAEDWEVGDCASLLMDSKGTKKIRDDVVEGAKYSAWALGK